MHAECSSAWHVVVHDSEDTLLHFSSVGCAQNNELLGREVDSNRGLVSNILDVFIGNKLACVHDSEIGASSGEVLLDLIKLASDEHLLHEKSMIGSA